MFDYTWEDLSPREFEIVACNYANDIFPDYSWSLTQLSRDDNHDFEAIFENNEKWGEAKHSDKPQKAMSRAQWDPTIVSAKLINSVDEVLLVTCSNIPLTYIIRSFHLIESSLEKVFYANRILLNKWYNSNPKLIDFDSKHPISLIKAKIKKKISEKSKVDTLKVFCFNQVERNYLTSLQEVHNKSVYEINIAMFISEKIATITIPISESIKYISDVYIYNVSYPNGYRRINSQVNYDLNINVSCGFNIIKLTIVIDHIYDNKSKVLFITFLNGKKNIKPLKVLRTVEAKRENIIQFEKEAKKLDSINNSILHIEYLPLECFKRYGKKYYFIRFDEREKYNFSKLCQLILHLITGIDFVSIDENVLRNTIIKYDDYLILEDFIIGVFDSMLAYECLSNIEKTSYIVNVLKHRQESNNYYYIIENTSCLNERGLKVINEIERNFILHKRQNVLIYQQFSPIQSQLTVINDSAVIVLFFDSGVLSRLIDKDTGIQNNKLINTDIEGKLVYPSYTNEISLSIGYLNNKNYKELARFFKQLIDIISIQTNSNRVLDSLALLRNRTNQDVLLCVLRQIRDIYYQKTDFWNAYGYSKLVDSINTQSPIEIYIDDLYKKADELNHCGSIIKARDAFSLVVELIDKHQLSLLLSKKIEALTEIYNICFWLLDTDGLISRIDKTMTEFYPNGVSTINYERAQYPYYNCLNRKMVTEYLLELYEDAEISFQICLNESKLKNYVAFAYMDSARGLYKKDIHKAYRRLKDAYKILCELKTSNQEIRRYYDCSVEIAYVKFVLANNSERKHLIRNLEHKVYDIKKHGLNSMAKKCYFKLAACYLVLGATEKARVYLDIIYNDKDFSNNPRNQMMYNNLQTCYFYLLSNGSNYYKAKDKKTLNFNCFAKDQKAELYIETRLW